MEIIILDGTKMTSPEAAHAYIAKAMRFPEYYGGNLDALADCLSGFGANTCVVLMNEDAMRQNLGGRAGGFLSVFEELSASPSAFSWVVCRD